MPMLYNAEGQAMGEVPDGTPVPLGRWVQNAQGEMVQGNGQNPAGQLVTGQGLNTGTGNVLTPNTAGAPGFGSATNTFGGAGGFGDLVTGGNTGGVLGTGVTGGAVGTTIAGNTDGTVANTGTTAGAGTTGTTGAGATPPPGGGLNAQPNLVTGNAPGVKPTYSQVYAAYMQANPGKTPTGDEFNTWAAANNFPEWTADAPGTPAPGTPGGVGGAAPNSSSAGTSSQTGTFGTTNTTDGTVNKTGGGTSVVDTTGNTVTTGKSKTGTVGNTTTTGTTTGDTVTTGTSDTTTGNTSNTTGTTLTSGTSDTTIKDTLGFGDLLKGQVGGTLAKDKVRDDFLQDVVNTGGSQFGSQVDQAVRNAISGPQMTGAGDSARARAAGYAGAQIGRNNLDQRIGAANSLAGPTGLQSLVSSGNPYLGSSTATTGKQDINQTTVGTGTANTITGGTSATTGTTAGTTDTTGTTTGETSGTTDVTGNTTGKTTNWEDLITKGKEVTGGTASSTGATNATGLAPDAKQISTGGGCVICTVGLEQGSFTTPRLLRYVVRHKLQKDWARFRHAARGYFFLFTPLARWLLGHPVLAWYCMPIAKAVVYEEARIAGRNLPYKLLPWLYHWTWHFGCSLVGRFPVPNGVTDKKVQDVAKRHGVLFQINDGGNK